MRIIGIDPGIGRVGWGIVDSEKGKQTVVEYGCIETKVKELTEIRLVQIFSELQRIIKEYRPEEAAIEQLFFNTNVTTAMAVGEARGVLLLTCANAGLPVASYTPLQIKMALTGFGRAEKNQIGHMVKLLLKLEKLPKLDDTTDALAIALTHAVSRKSKARV